MELLLVRHAIPERRIVDHGPADPELSDAGHRQSELLAAYLGSESFDALYSSPLRRALQTADPLGRTVNLPTVIVDGVAEFDRHSSEYVPVEELKRSNDPRWRQLVETGMTGSEEDAADFHDRVVSTIEGLVSAHPSGKIAVVCHGGVINTYLAHVLDLPGRRAFFYPNYTSIHRVAAARSGERAVVTVNETAHLRGSGLPVGLLSN